eukprot:scaffold8129_cov363-Prasinococcus_capsulatus_cf.AAC.7
MPTTTASKVLGERRVPESFEDKLLELRDLRRRRGHGEQLLQHSQQRREGGGDQRAHIAALLHRVVHTSVRVRCARRRPPAHPHAHGRTSSLRYSYLRATIRRAQSAAYSRGCCGCGRSKLYMMLGIKSGHRAGKSS